MLIRMPNREGWYIEWLKGYKTITRKNGTTVERPIMGDFTSESKEEVMRKKAELEAQGFEVKGPMECIF